MIHLYEKNSIKVDESLVVQYLQNKKIAKDFAIYYDLWCKYKSDYQVDTILSGKADLTIKDRAKNAKFDERLSLLGLVIDAVTNELKAVTLKELALTEILTALKNVKIEMTKSTANAEESIHKQIKAIEKKISDGKKSSTISADTEYSLRSAKATLSDILPVLKKESPEDNTKAFALIKKEFDKKTKVLKKQAEDAGKQLSNVFTFCEEVFGDGQEILILVTELTISYYGARFISRYGCKEYFNHNKELLFNERQKEIITELENLDL